jgi:hypothetical protein
MELEIQNFLKTIIDGIYIKDYYKWHIQLNPFITNRSERPKAFVKSEFSL